MNKEYKIRLVLGEEEIASLLNGEICTFNFIPTEDTEYEDRLSVDLGYSKDDVPLSEGMNLVVDNLAEV
jgi:hypothetical protein|tara:strand:+ start:344 stop:550 length:207 start_codon:yes stop_codon:yes gene_type:complete